MTLSLTLRAPAACTVGNKSADEEIIVLFLLCLRILLTFLLTALKGQSDQIFFLSQWNNNNTDLTHRNVWTEVYLVVPQYSRKYACAFPKHAS